MIDQIAREGARRMLAEAPRAEVDAYITAFADERDEHGHRLVMRTGYHASREVLTSAGAVEVTGPRVNDRRGRPTPVSGGFLLKDATPAELVAAVRTVAAGESLLAPCGDPAADRRFAGNIRPREGTNPVGVLARREIEVLKLIAAGCPMWRSRPAW